MEDIITINGIKYERMKESTKEKISEPVKKIDEDKLVESLGKLTTLITALGLEVEK